MTEKAAERAPEHWPDRIVTVISVLVSVGVGALIFYWATRSRQVPQMHGYATPQYIPPPPRMMPQQVQIAAPDLSPLVDQIRTHIRAANTGVPGEAAAALALLDDAEARYGATALSEVCNPTKLRTLIARVQAKLG